MSEEERNVALAKRAVEAYQRGDLDAFLDLMDPDFEVFNSPEMPNAGTFRGHEGYLRWIGEWLDAWEYFKLDPQEYVPVGERHVLIRQRQYGKGKGSGVEVDMEVWYMAEFRDGVGVRMHLYPTREQALEVALAGEANDDTAGS
jgi:ketosteroid isomerase-like protein